MRTERCWERFPRALTKEQARHGQARTSSDIKCWQPKGRGVSDGYRGQSQAYFCGDWSNPGVNGDCIADRLVMGYCYRGCNGHQDGGHCYKQNPLRFRSHLLPVAFDTTKPVLKQWSPTFWQMWPLWLIAGIVFVMSVWNAMFP